MQTVEYIIVALIVSAAAFALLRVWKKGRSSTGVCESCPLSSDCASEKNPSPRSPRDGARESSVEKENGAR